MDKGKLHPFPSLFIRICFSLIIYIFFINARADDTGGLVTLAPIPEPIPVKINPYPDPIQPPPPAIDYAVPQAAEGKVDTPLLPPTLPEFDHVVQGRLEIVKQDKHMDMMQGQDDVIANFRSFNIDDGHSVYLHQYPNTRAFFRVINQSDITTINGIFKADSTVYLVTPNGLLIGPNGVLDMQNILLTTHDIKNDAFLGMPISQTLTLDPLSNPGVIISNHGTIQTNGFAALVAPTVRNSGLIQGNIFVGAGGKADLSFAGNDLIQMRISGKLKRSLIDQRSTGKLSAHGKKVVITAGAVEEAANGIINLRGTIDASDGQIIVEGGENTRLKVHGDLSVEGTAGKGGKIYLNAPITQIGKTAILNASSQDYQGGEINVFGEHIGVYGDKTLETNGATITASGGTGGGTILVGGNHQGKGPEPNAKTLYVEDGVQLFADAWHDGNAGEIIHWSDGISILDGKASASAFGKTGDGGFIEYSGKHYLQFKQDKAHMPRLTRRNGKAGTFLIDPTTITIGGNTSHEYYENDFADGLRYDDIAMTINTGSDAWTQGGFLVYDHRTTFNREGDYTDWYTHTPSTVGADYIASLLTTNNVIIQAADVIRLNTSISAPYSTNTLTFTCLTFSGNGKNILLGDTTHSATLSMTTPGSSLNNFTADVSGVVDMKGVGELNNLTISSGTNILTSNIGGTVTRLTTVGNNISTLTGSSLTIGALIFNPSPTITNTAGPLSLTSSTATDALTLNNASNSTTLTNVTANGGLTVNAPGATGAVTITGGSFTGTNAIYGGSVSVSGTNATPLSFGTATVQNNTGPLALSYLILTGSLTASSSNATTLTSVTANSGLTVNASGLTGDITIIDGSYTGTNFFNGNSNSNIILRANGLSSAILSRISSAQTVTIDTDTTTITGNMTPNIFGLTQLTLKTSGDLILKGTIDLLYGTLAFDTPANGLKLQGNSTLSASDGITMTSPIQVIGGPWDLSLLLKGSHADRNLSYFINTAHTFRNLILTNNANGNLSMNANPIVTGSMDLAYATIPAGTVLSAPNTATRIGLWVPTFTGGSVNTHSPVEIYGTLTGSANFAITTDTGSIIFQSGSSVNASNGFTLNGPVDLNGSSFSWSSAAGAVDLTNSSFKSLQSTTLTLASVGGVTAFNPSLRAGSVGPVTFDFGTSQTTLKAGAATNAIALTLNGSNLRLADTFTYTSTASAGLTLNGNLSASATGKTLTLTPAGTLTINGAINGAAGYYFQTVTLASTTVLSTNASITAPTIALNNSTLTSMGTNTLGGIDGASTINVTTGATIINPENITFTNQRFRPTTPDIVTLNLITEALSLTLPPSVDGDRFGTVNIKPRTLSGLRTITKTFSTIPKTIALNVYTDDAEKALLNPGSTVTFQNADLKNSPLTLNFPYTTTLSNLTNVAGLTLNSVWTTSPASTERIVKVMTDLTSAGAINFGRSRVMIGYTTLPMTGITTTAGDITSDQILYPSTSTLQTTITAAGNLTIRQREVQSTAFNSVILTGQAVTVDAVSPGTGLVASLIITGEATTAGIVLSPYYKAPAVALRGVGVTTSGDLSSTSFTNLALIGTGAGNVVTSTTLTANRLDLQTTGTGNITINNPLYGNGTGTATLTSGGSITPPASIGGDTGRSYTSITLRSSNAFNVTSALSLYTNNLSITTTGTGQGISITGSAFNVIGSSGSGSNVSLTSAGAISLLETLGASDKIFASITATSVDSFTLAADKALSVYAKNFSITTTGTNKNININGPLSITGDGTGAATFNASSALNLNNIFTATNYTTATLKAGSLLSLGGTISASGVGLIFDTAPSVQVSAATSITALSLTRTNGATATTNAGTAQNLTLALASDFNVGSILSMTANTFNNLSITGTGSNVSVNQSLSAGGNLTIGSTGTGKSTTLNSSNLTSAGTLTINGLLSILDADSTLTAGGNMLFTGAMTATGRGVTLSAAGYDISINGITAGFLTTTSNTLTFASGDITITNNATINSNVRLTNAVHTLTSTSGNIALLAGGNIGMITSAVSGGTLKLSATAGTMTVEPKIVGPQAMTLRFLSGASQLKGNVTSGQGLTITSDTEFIGVLENLTYTSTNGGLTFSSSLVPLVGGLNLSLKPQGPLTLTQGIGNSSGTRFTSVTIGNYVAQAVLSIAQPNNHVVVSGSVYGASIDVSNAYIRLTTDVEFNSSGAITTTNFTQFEGTTDYLQGLTLILNTNFTLPAMGNVHPLKSLTVNAGNGEIDFSNARPIYINGDRTLISTADIHLENADVSFLNNFGTLRIGTTRNVTLPNIGQITPVTTLDLSGITGTVILGNVKATNSIILPSLLDLSNSPTLQAETIRFNNAAVDINGGSLSLLGNILTRPNTTFTQKAGGRLKLGGSITGTGTLTFNTPIELLRDISLKSDSIILNPPGVVQGIAGRFGLTIEETGGFTFNDTIGTALTPLTYFVWRSSQSLRGRINADLYADYVKLWTPDMQFGPGIIHAPHLHLIPTWAATVPSDQRIIAIQNADYPFQIWRNTIQNPAYFDIKRLTLGDPNARVPILINNSIQNPGIHLVLYGEPIYVGLGFDYAKDVEFRGTILRDKAHNDLWSSMQEYTADYDTSPMEGALNSITPPENMPMAIIPMGQINLKQQPVDSLQEGDAEQLIGLHLEAKPLKNIGGEEEEDDKDEGASS